ncbi:hypothetical protein [Yersinia intermedia]|uniref:hypothetical protein n=1 Tax=Yersinia intermedia TaxID=631 RepID=UPI0005DE2A11|nr:hypothetical protein [Yersinia intermedia]CND48381.1 Uncharacterised protein [Yersinia intermedia]
MNINGINKDKTSLAPGIAPRVLTLNVKPGREFEIAFENAYKNYFNPSKREMKILGNDVIILCMLDELQAQINIAKKLLIKATEQIQAIENECEILEDAAKQKQKEDAEKDA